MPWSKFPTISVLKLWLTFLKTGLAGNKVWHLEKCICGSVPFMLDGEENLLLIRWSKLELSGRDMSLTQDSLLIPTWNEGISSLCSKEIKICLHERDREVNPQMEVWLSSINGHVDSKVESWVPVPASRTLLLFFPVTDECHIGKVSLAKKWQLSSQPADPGRSSVFQKNRDLAFCRGLKFLIPKTHKCHPSLLSQLQYPELLFLTVSCHLPAQQEWL